MTSIIKIGNQTWINGVLVNSQQPEKNSKNVLVELDGVPLDKDQSLIFLNRLKNETIKISGGYVKTGSTNVELNGNCQSISSTSGDLSCGKCNGRASSVSGDIKISGSSLDSTESVSGDVKVHGVIYGNINTVSGDVRSRAKFS